MNLPDNYFDKYREKYNPTLKIRGILPTMYKKTTTHSAGVVDKAREIWGDKVFPIEVPETISFPRAYTAGLPLPLFDPEHEGSLAYLAVARLLYPVSEQPHDLAEPAGEQMPDPARTDSAPEPTGAAFNANETVV